MKDNLWILFVVCVSSLVSFGFCVFLFEGINWTGIERGIHTVISFQLSLLIFYIQSIKEKRND